MSSRRDSTCQHNLPRQLTPFINRLQELTDLLDLLADSACPLLTLVGPGGIGKTRLALEAAQRILDCRFWILDLDTPDNPKSKIQNPKFPDGLFFVNLQPVHSAELLAATIAEALHLSLKGQDALERQVLEYLADKELLLLLDNVEQLLPALVVPLTRILTAAPGVKLLVTSRTVLNMREEWVYPVPGLPYPLPRTSQGAADPAPDEDAVADSDLMDYAAVRLFVEQAQRVRRDFALAEEQGGVVRICQLVEGIPLALELAATWTKTLPCAVIADEIARNLEFLTTPLHNVPAQHRSLRAVFEHSWAVLTPEEQQVFQRLAIFRNGFTREAAAAAAGATLLTLSALVDKSLINRKADNRYQIHELLRQFGEERLFAAETETEQVQQAHAAYYSRFLQQRIKAMSGGQQQQATAAIGADYENIRLAWQWLLDHGDVDRIGRAVFAFIAFYTFRSQYHEGLGILEQSVRALRLTPPTPARQQALASTLVGVGWMHIRLGQLAEAQSALEESQMLHTAGNLLPQPGLATDPLLGLGVLALTRGNYATATTLGEEARQRSLQHGHRPNLPIAWYILAQAAQAQGHDDAAAHCAQQAYVATQTTHDRWFMAYCLVTLGDIASTRGTYTEAAQHYEAAYQLRTAFEDPEGMAHALYRLGTVALRTAEYAEAQSLLKRSLALYQATSDRGGRAWVLTGLGLAACALGDRDAARHYWASALRIATEIHYLPLLLELCTNVAELLLQADEAEFAIALLVCALRHPACGSETGDRARHLLDHWRTQLPRAIFAKATQAGQSQELDTLTTRLQTWLMLPTAIANPPNKGITNGSVVGAESEPKFLRQTNGAAKEVQPLIEPLTERELEVLHLLTNGLSNAEIADTLILAVGTVKFYTAQIYGKLGVRNRTQATVRAHELQLLSIHCTEP